MRSSTLVSLSLLTLLALVPAGAQVTRLDPAPLLDAYAQGRFDEALAPVGRATRDQARDLRQRLVLGGSQWADAVPDDRPRRVLAAAAFALEAARIRAEAGEWAADQTDCVGRCVIEWACTLLRTRGTPDEAERIWMLASIALANGVREWTFLQTPLARPTQRTIEQGHVHHAIGRLSEEPRFRLARAVALASRHVMTGEMDTPREGTRTSPNQDGVIRFQGPAVVLSAIEQRRTSVIEYVKEELEALVSDAAVGPEARIRLGYHHWVTGHTEEALAAYVAAAGATPDPDLKYVASFLAAQAAQALGDLRAAEAHYNAALTARPHSQSATLGLAALLYVRGEAKQAHDLVDASRSARPRDDDPWRMFLYGGFAKLPAFVAELRRLVKP